MSSTTNVANATKPAQLAIDQGPKAFPRPTATPRRKIGVEEFFSIAERFGFTPEAMQRLRASVGEDDLVEGGPNLAKYASTHPKPSKGARFEEMAREIFGAKHALGVSSGTAALHSAMVAVGVKPGTEVICPALGFYATAGAVMLAGGTPVFCDVDASMQIDSTKIEALITPRTVAVAPTHHWGTVCDMDPIMEIARRRKIRVVEDCAQSPGGTYKGKHVGAIGDIGCFSISCYKIIGGGEGGMVLTSDDRFWERANQLAESGGLWRGAIRFHPPRYEGELFVGTNYRLSELESAVNVVQLAKLAKVVRGYHETKMRVCRQLDTYREIVPQKLNDVAGEVGYFLRFYPETVELSRKIADALIAEGITAITRGGATLHDWHLYSHMYPLFDGLDESRLTRYRKGTCPVADDLYERVVTIPLENWYAPADADAIAAGINKVLSAYCTADEAAIPWPCD